MAVLSVVLAFLISCGASVSQQQNVSLPISPQSSSLQMALENNRSCPSAVQREAVLEYTTGDIRSQLLQLSKIVSPCEPHIIGKTSHCPASNCSEIFELAKGGLFHFSGLYWLKLPNGSASRIYCNRETGWAEVSSCELLLYYHPNAPSGTYTLLLPDGVRSVVYCNNETGQAEPQSCAHAHQLELPSGTYTIRPPGGSPVSVFCDMDKEECGSRWWTRVASYNYTDTNTSCPSNWNQTSNPIRACGRREHDGCSSVFVSAHGHHYSHVCGRVIAFQVGAAYGFWLSTQSDSLDSAYLNGISITHGSESRQHIWSLAASLGNTYCPCSNPEAPHPSFVGNSYFCETDFEALEAGEYNLNNPLWDGERCVAEDKCCSFNHPPWFSTALPNSTSDDIEVRICGVVSPSEYNTPITVLELYVQ